MLKIKIENTEIGPLYVFGLSKMNIQKLQEGFPIKFKLDTLGEKGEVMIFAGDTEEAMTKQLQDAGLLPALDAKGEMQ